ncbi:S8 family serine peptidase [Novosphingobium beihaiensis]|uniref:S8 family serine peptidase n=1 Tax=Novosphingobium beihaiensis TaxID=2930389 RepID=A0ABT0BUF2_9SPHN|nr:S8 family serine peptidase [Novosphingobium beihaiensis]MCJ2188610.1 S8 family serine peptidase [Novosphingobium beihaiensis]
MCYVQTTLPVDGTMLPGIYFYNDTYEKKQWYLDGSALSPLSIDAFPVWADYTGTGVKIGVIDSQIDFRHTDLQQAYDTALDYNFVLGTGDVSIDDDNVPYYHGTAVAGIIAAEAGNAYGIAGIASGATLVGLAIDYESSEVIGQILAALEASAETDAVNNSWSFSAPLADDFNRYPELGEALEYPVVNGRGGLGTTVVFAAGNAYSEGSSNYHNFQNSPYTVAVGAVMPDGNPVPCTSLGANVLISAAGYDVYTTTLKGRFAAYAGTSFAAPAVTAAAGLVLQANPELGYRDVQQILAYSARREGLSDAASFGDGWRTNGAANFNGGGLHFSDTFGYGFLNVHDAVRLAETWSGQHTYANLARITQSVQIDGELVAGSADHVSAQITLDQAIAIEHVQLSLDLRWVNTGDLDIYLTSPDGTAVRLAYDLPYDERAGRMRDFTFSSVASMGEQSAGIWTIDVYNRKPDATEKDGSPMTGLLQDATLTVLGSDDGMADDTYIYTDEFGTLYSAAALAARSVLDDTDGGNDTINAAAVTSGSVIDLSGASPSMIAGVTLSITPGTIENAFGGDGGDALTGSVLSNRLSGGRGDDTIYFSFGNDTLDGGEGNDSLVVNASFGSITGAVNTGGEVAISLRTGEVSTVSHIETFIFSDAVYTHEEMLALLASGGPPDNAISGTDADDTIKGTAGADLIEGLGGDDRMSGYDGDDVLNGGSGSDRLSGGAGHDTLDGAAGDDTLFGEAGDDELYGLAGADLIKGGAGNDWIEGGAGRDRLYGDGGADTFVIDAADLGTLDIIYDFSVAEGDRILITGASGSAAFSFVPHGSSTYLEMHAGGETINAVRIKGDGIEDLGTSLTMSTVDEGILWA